MTDIAPRAFVTGWPVRHSRSPAIHRFWLDTMGLAGSYEALAVSPQDFPAFLAGLSAAGLAGGNVTIPHKEAAFASVEKRDADARAIGAVNTLWFEAGRLVGGNTDSYGFSANLDERLPGWRNAGEAVVLGAGGAARAVVHALAAAGVGRVRIVNRTLSRAREVAGAFGPAVTAHGVEEEAALLSACDLLVNTRPSAEAGGSGKGVVDLDALPDHALVTDIVYVPLETPILASARARGLRAADGLGMLLHQAAPGFERWFGRRPVVDEALRAHILRNL
ncbi:shikimate dehydrogenase [Aureimonas populi]|uniref:Shikimate dehydrogenase (NADP(+)) n=1 Tax=Aureimonas populi TaxID=1701758 RepID=A0ABW5CPK5_9HYPH|nr:shikimate dehydrogenase [Aureimonas populi]